MLFHWQHDHLYNVSKCKNVTGSIWPMLKYKIQPFRPLCAPWIIIVDNNNDPGFIKMRLNILIYLLFFNHMLTNLKPDVLTNQFIVHVCFFVRFKSLFLSQGLQWSSGLISSITVLLNCYTAVSSNSERSRCTRMQP